MKKSVFLSMLGVLAITGTAMAQKTVYFVGGSQGPDLPRNSVYIDLLADGLTFLNEELQEVTVPGLGYNVTYVDAGADEDAAVGETMDLVILHESASSGDFDQYINRDVAVLGIEQVIAAGRPGDRAGSLFFTPQSGVICCAEGDFEVEVLDGDHPITEPWNTGDFFAVTQNLTTAQISGIDPNTLAEAATPLLGSGFTTGTFKITLAVIEAGATGLAVNDGESIPAGSEPTPARRAFLGYHERVQVFENDTDSPDLISITEDGARLFQRVVQWLVGDLGGPIPGGGSDVAEWSIH